MGIRQVTPGPVWTIILLLLPTMWPAVATAEFSPNTEYGYIRNPNGSFTTFEMPPGVDGFFIGGFNNTGQVAGYYNSSYNNTRGFIHNADGGLTTFAIPGGPVNFAEGTVSGINDSGVVSGSEGNGSAYGYLRGPDGTITSFDVPGATYVQASGLNNSGQVVGSYDVYRDEIYSGLYGYVRAYDGSITAFSAIAGSDDTSAQAINDVGQVAGSVLDPTTHGYVGFIRNNDGSVTIFRPEGYYVFVTDINNSGQLVGNSGYGGFFRDTDGSLTTITIPGGSTFVGGLNSLGQVAGNYYFYGDTGNITEYGFIRDADGTITTFDLPFTPPAGTDLLFTVDGINDRGQVVGKFFASQAIPEPTSAILLGFGAVIVLAYRTGGRRLAISTLSRTLGRRDCHLT